MIAPQLVGKSEQIKLAGKYYAVRKRRRSDVIPGRFKVYSEPDHKATAEYLVGISDGKSPNKATKHLKQACTGVLVLYPVKGWT